LFIGVSALILAPSAAATYFYRQYQEAKKLVANPQEIAKNEITAIIEKISKVMDLPEGEEPTLATVLEADKLREQPFFTKAENGDKVLIYTQAKKAILYRPSQNKIINVSPLSLTNGTESSETQPIPTTSKSPATKPTATETPTPTPETSE